MLLIYGRSLRVRWSGSSASHGGLHPIVLSEHAIKNLLVRLTGVDEAGDLRQVFGPIVTLIDDVLDHLNLGGSQVEMRRGDVVAPSYWSLVG